MLEIIFYILIILGVLAAVAYSAAGLVGLAFALGIVLLSVVLFVGILAFPRR